MCERNEDWFSEWVYKISIGNTITLSIQKERHGATGLCGKNIKAVRFPVSDVPYKMER